MKNEEKSINHEELASLSGESALRRPPQLKCKILKLNGTTGVFKEYDPETDETEDLGEEAVEFTILKIRRMMMQYGADSVLFTNEHASTKTKNIALMERDGGTVMKIKEGTNEELRKEYPNLRTFQVLYVWHGGEIKKLMVKGASLKRFYEYIGSFEENEHIYSVLTEIRPVKEKNKGGMEYYVLEFNKVGDSELSVVAEKIKEISKVIKAQDDFYAESASDISMAKNGEEEIEAEEDIDPENIPF
jgi:hypothetical protein